MRRFAFALTLLLIMDASWAAEKSRPAACRMPADAIPAKAVTPDVVPPCFSGSGGICPKPDYVYMTSTGWCRPKATVARELAAKATANHGKPADARSKAASPPGR